MEKSIIILFLGVLVGWFGNNLLHVEVPQPQIALGASTSTSEYLDGARTEYRNVWWVSDKDAVDRALRTRESEPDYKYGDRKLKGMATWNGEDCTIYAYEPQGENDYDKLETFGHELLHCFRGSFHQ